MNESKMKVMSDLTNLIIESEVRRENDPSIVAYIVWCKLKSSYNDEISEEPICFCDTTYYKRLSETEHIDDKIFFYYILNNDNLSDLLGENGEWEIVSVNKQTLTNIFYNEISK